MPTYEFRCLKCKKRFDLMIAYADYDTVVVTCPHCGSGNVSRLITHVRVTHNSLQRMADLADPANMSQIEDDPRALGRAMREMQGELGEDMGGEFTEVVDRLEKGQSPDEIDQAFPDLGSPDLSNGNDMAGGD
jgi:putative FmdB family regulatory protein